MKHNISHKSALFSHYDTEAEQYDAFNEENSQIINQTLAKILKEHNVTSVLDMTCGTGSQVFFLANQGFKVVGSDINAEMLRIAKDKASKEKLDIQFTQGDICSLKVGKFDAVIAIFNAIGHLAKDDFEKAIRNIRSNLKDNGLFIFDIFNLSYLLEGNNITNLTIDWQKISDDIKIRNIQYSTIDSNGILASYTTYFEHHGAMKPKISESAQTLQVYTAQQLKDMLNKNGFQVIRQCDINGLQLDVVNTERILTIAVKQ